MSTTGETRDALIWKEGSSNEGNPNYEGGKLNRKWQTSVLLPQFRLDDCQSQCAEKYKLGVDVQREQSDLQTELKLEPIVQYSCSVLPPGYHPGKSVNFTTSGGEKSKAKDENETDVCRVMLVVLAVLAVFAVLRCLRLRWRHYPKREPVKAPVPRESLGCKSYLILQEGRPETDHCQMYEGLELNEYMSQEDVMLKRAWNERQMKQGLNYSYQDFPRGHNQPDIFSVNWAPPYQDEVIPSFGDSMDRNTGTELEIYNPHENYREEISFVTTV